MCSAAACLNFLPVTIQPLINCLEYSLSQFSLPFTIDAPAERPRVPPGTVEQRSTGDKNLGLSSHTIYINYMTSIKSPYFNPVDRNVVVLTSSSGIFCVCNQVPYPSRQTRPAGDSFKLVYEIISLHQGIN